MALVRIEAGGRLVDDDAASAGRPARSRCRAAASCRPRIRRPPSCATSQRLVCLSSACDELAPLARARHALERREVIEHALGAQVRIEAELLRQVAEDLADVVGLRRGRRCRRVGRCPSRAAAAWRSVRISVDLPAPLGPSRPNMPAGMSSETLFRARTPLAYVFERPEMERFMTRVRRGGLRYPAITAGSIDPNCHPERSEGLQSRSPPSLRSR